MRRCLAVMFGLLLGMVEVGANAQGVLIVVDPGHPVPLPRPIPRPEPPPASYRVKELNVQAKISSQVARVQVSQSFVNTGSRQMEVQFVGSERLRVRTVSDPGRGRSAGNEPGILVLKRASQDDGAGLAASR